MIFLRLAFKSILNRRLTTFLTVLSIALSVALLLSVERTKRASEEGFTNAISQTDLIVGARSGPINLLLYTVFNVGSATNNISYKTYDHFKNDPSVEWTIPYSLGDGHRGFRVIGTDHNFYEHYHFRGDHAVKIAKGERTDGLWDAVIGAEVAKTLHYDLGQKIVLAHGVTRGEGVILHSDKPFTVVAIMEPTGTALDQAVYISLEGLEALHIDWQNGAMPTAEKMVPQDKIKKEDIQVQQITSFFLRTKSRIQILKLQRDINNYIEEPLLAIIPGVALADLWHGLGYIEQVLKIISWMVIAVGLVAMLIALLTSLNERRREMSILRALGATPFHIILLLVFESTLLTLLGIALGTLTETLVFLFLKSWLENEFGLYLIGNILTSTDLLYLFVVFVMGLIIGVVPAVRAMRTALKDGLSVKV